MIIMTHVITYATHSHGLFEKLLNNEHDIEVTVLGWGKKWNGLRDKPLGVLEHLEKLNDNDLVIFLDGFDSIINTNLEEIEHRFNDMIKENPEMRVLLSIEQCYNKQTNIFFKYFFKYMQYKVYSCDGHVIVNSGLYMGYVKELKILLGEHRKNKNKNIDQILLNKIYWKYNFVKVDIDNKIFYNCPAYMCIKGDACFTQFPGEFNFQRVKRAIMMDYGHCFKTEKNIMMIMLGLFLIYKSLY